MNPFSFIMYKFFREECNILLVFPNLLRILNWFYTLELNQVDFYNSQSKSVKDAYLKRCFTHFADVEQLHVNNIADQIKKIGGKPILIADYLAPLAGKTAGKLVPLLGLDVQLRINIMIENKAIKDYQLMINKLDDCQLKSIFWGNLIDEQSHVLSFEQELSSRLSPET